jgi:hypothetical protein
MSCTEVSYFKTIVTFFVIAVASCAAMLEEYEDGLLAVDQFGISVICVICKSSAYFRVPSDV